MILVGSRLLPPLQVFSFQFAYRLLHQLVFLARYNFGRIKMNFENGISLLILRQNEIFHWKFYGLCISYSFVRISVQIGYVILIFSLNANFVNESISVHISSSAFQNNLLLPYSFHMVSYRTIKETSYNLRPQWGRSKPFKLQ